jgi:hypothetical protein
MLVLRFVETRFFTAQIQEIGGEEALRDLQDALKLSPAAGDVIAGTNGLRKVRFKLPGRGKSSGARVIYLLLPEIPCIVFIYLYAKARKTDLTAAEKSTLRQVADDLKANQHLIP